MGIVNLFADMTSMASGLHYEHSRVALLVFAVTVQLPSISLFVLMRAPIGPLLVPRPE
jgi:hypothetical protein